MNTMMTTASGPAELAKRWPEFSAPELRRLHVVAYCRRTGRLHPPSPVGPEVEALCAALLRHTDPSTPPPTPPGALGVPPLWAAWAAHQRARQRAASGRAPANAWQPSEREGETC